MPARLLRLTVKWTYPGRELTVDGPSRSCPSMWWDGCEPGAGGRGTIRRQNRGGSHQNDLHSADAGGETVSTTTFSGAGSAILNRFNEVRRSSIGLCEPLSAEDMMVQSCPEASPVKWHLAHTAWFFESFVLREFLPGYRLFNEDFPWLFNSYYEGFSAFPEKRLRSSFSRPGLEEILRYREHVDAAMQRLLKLNPDDEALRRIELGVNHEEQHQELLLRSE